VAEAGVLLARRVFGLVATWMWPLNSGNRLASLVIYLPSLVDVGRPKDGLTAERRPDGLATA
jgi:hypothetical protein